VEAQFEKERKDLALKRRLCQVATIAINSGLFAGGADGSQHLQAKTGIPRLKPMRLEDAVKLWQKEVSAK
jgi:hypothetical protein